MGFNLFKAIGGAATGFLAGGPIGAVAGGVAGGFSSPDSATNSSRANQTQTEYTQLREFTPQEQSVYDQAIGNLQASGKPLTEQEKQALRERIFAASYNPQAQAIEQGYATAGATDYANAARRGGGFNSASADRADLRTASKSRELGRAADSATLTAENQILQEQENRRMASASALDQMNAMWDARLKGSKIVRTGGSASESTVTGQDNFWQTAAAGVGSALTNKDSWWNKRSTASADKPAYGGSGTVFSKPSTNPFIPSNMRGVPSS